MMIFDRLFRKAINRAIQDNLLNRALYTYGNNVAYIPPADIRGFVDDGYKSNVHVYSVVTSILNRCTGIELQHFAGDKEIENSELLQLLEQPNEMQPWDQFITAAMGWLLLTGNIYIYKISPEEGLNKGKVTEMWLLPSHLVEIIGGGIMQPVKEYRVMIGAGYSIPIAAENVLHVKYFNPDYNEGGAHLYGQSPLQAALNTIGANNAGYTALNKSYTNGAPAGILTGTENTGLDYTKEQIEQLNQRWKREAGGEDNFRKLIFSRNPMQFISMGWSPVDMNILNHLKYTLQDICNIYHAPIHLFSGEAATLDNYKEARKAIYTDAVIPLFDMVIPALSNWIASKYQAGSKLDYSIANITELNADVKSLAQALSPAWWMTGNEKRATMGLPEHPDPAMNEILYPAQLIPGTDMLTE